MEVWKILFLSKWVICRFHVSFLGCNSTHLQYIYIILFISLIWCFFDVFRIFVLIVWFRFRFDFSIVLIVFLWVDLSWFGCNYVDLFALFCTYICFLCCKCSCLLLSKVESVSVKDFQLFTGNIMYKRTLLELWRWLSPFFTACLIFSFPGFVEHVIVLLLWHINGTYLFFEEGGIVFKTLLPCKIGEINHHIMGAESWDNPHLRGQCYPGGAFFATVTHVIPDGA